LGTYVQGDITNLPFPDKVFDCTYCYDVLEHVDDQLAIQELARVTLKKLIIAVPKEDEIMTNFGLTFSHHQDKTHLRNYTEKSLKELFSSINYSSIVIFSELAVPTKYLVQEMIEPQIADSPLESFYRKVYNFLLNKLLDKASYKTVYTGLVAVVDL
jgi:ubiquinone/menaquinone biosynthesis C-methylase UbiE